MNCEGVPVGGDLAARSTRTKLRGRFILIVIAIFLLCILMLITLYVKIYRYSYSQSKKYPIIAEPLMIYPSTDGPSPGSPYKNGVAAAFSDLFVENVTGTDCSFIAAFMLVMNRDPSYPYKVMTALDGGKYLIRFPGYDREEIVTPADMENFFAHSTLEKWHWKSLFREHHVPIGIDILRSAYYDAQRRLGERPPGYRVYGGGNPVSDLMVLTGIKEGEVIRVDASKKSGSRGVATFSNSRAMKVKYVLKRGRTTEVSVEDVGEMVNPLKILTDMKNYMVIASSAGDYGFRHRIFGKTIPNHAYYYLGMTRNNEYIFGNPYQTVNPAIFSESDFLEEFNSIHYVKIQ